MCFKETPPRPAAHTTTNTSASTSERHAVCTETDGAESRSESVARRWTMDEDYPTEIVLVMDNLNRHKLSSLYEVSAS